MIDALGGLSLKPALQAEAEQLQEDGKIRRQALQVPHKKMAALQAENAAQLKEKAGKLGGFGLFNFILDLVVGLTSIFGEYLSPITQQVSKVIDAGGNLARRIKTLIDSLDEEKRRPRGNST